MNRSCTSGVCDPELIASAFFFFQAEDGIRDLTVTGAQTCALPISQLEDRGIPDHPVGSSLVDGLQAPIAMRPARPERGIALMDLFEQVRDGFPAERGRHLRAHVEVDSRNEEKSARRDESRKVPQAFLCFQPPHATG